MKLNFEKYCKDYENIENYEAAKADNFKNWNCHHRLETHFASGERRTVDISAAELKTSGMYYRRPASELIFLTVREHNSLHRKGKPLTEEARKKLSEAHKGKPKSEAAKKKLSEANKGKRLSEEHKRKIGEARKGMQHSMEARKKISEGNKGKRLSDKTRRRISEAKKGKHISEETKKKLSEARKGTRWFNNGKMNIRAKECPDGFVPGILR